MFDPLVLKQPCSPKMRGIYNFMYKKLTKLKFMLPGNFLTIPSKKLAVVLALCIVDDCHELLD